MQRMPEELRDHPAFSCFAAESPQDSGRRTRSFHTESSRSRWENSRPWLSGLLAFLAERRTEHSGSHRYFKLLQIRGIWLGSPPVPLGGRCDHDGGLLSGPSFGVSTSLSSA